MSIHNDPMFSTLAKFQEMKSQESAETQNSAKRILVIKKVDGKEELAIVEKKELGFWTRLLTKLGFGNANFTNVVNFIHRNVTHLNPKGAESEAETWGKIVKAVEFLNTKIQQYRSAHSFLLPLGKNPQELNLPAIETLTPPVESTNLQKDAGLQQDADLQQSVSLQKDADDANPKSNQTSSIDPSPEPKVELTKAEDRAESDDRSIADALILHNYSREELVQLEQASVELYEPLLPAKGLLEGGATILPEELKAIDDKLVPEFRFVESSVMGFMNQCHRSWGTNLETLVKLEGVNACYPANRVTLGGSSYIQAEAPRQEPVFEEGKHHYYQMAIESDAKLLVTASTGFRRSYDKKTDKWTMTPDKETMDFLLPGESIQIAVPGKPTYTIACEAEEQCISLPEAIREKAKLEGPCHYHVRTLTVTNDQDSTKRTIRQMVPDFVPVGVPFELSQFTVDLAESLSETPINENRTIIVNCNTGRDRSGQFIILHSMRREIEKLLVDGGMTLEAILSKIDVVDQLRARAFMLARQSTEGAGVDSIEKTLLPCFNEEVRVAERRLYSTMSEAEKATFHQTINGWYANWMKSLPEFEIYGENSVGKAGNKVPKLPDNVELIG